MAGYNFFTISYSIFVELKARRPNLAHKVILCGLPFVICDPYHTIWPIPFVTHTDPEFRSEPSLLQRAHNKLKQSVVKEIECLPQVSPADLTSDVGTCEMWYVPLLTTYKWTALSSSISFHLDNWICLFLKKLLTRSCRKTFTFEVLIYSGIRGWWLQ